MAKDRTLRAALDRFQGKDLKLERQKKLQKKAGKKAKSHQDGKENDGDDGGVPLDEAGVQKAIEEIMNASDVSSEDEEEPEYDLSRLDDSDSESEIETGADGVNGSPPKHVVGEIGIDEEEEEEDDDASIALSDISTGSATEDIVPHQRLTINNTTALSKALKSISLPYSSLPFSEHQSVTTTDPVSIPDVEDDLNRELAFYAQALSAAKTGRQKLRAEGVPFTRPVDYFAEMVKSDEHMGKIKAKLIDDAAAKKASAEARKQRDLKKFGKQVQQEKLKERAKEKKDMLEKVKILKRKRQSTGIEADREENIFDVALEDASTTDRKDRSARRDKPNGQPNSKRAKKNEKFGFGGKKRFAKSTDAASTGDMSGFSTKKMKGQTSKSGAAKRLGKSRRMKR